MSKLKILSQDDLSTISDAFGEILEKEVAFNNEEEAENWAEEHFNYDCYACITKI